MLPKANMIHFVFLGSDTLQEVCGCGFRFELTIPAATE
jgi:hypothetical protein